MMGKFNVYLLLPFKKNLMYTWNNGFFLLDEESHNTFWTQFCDSDHSAWKQISYNYLPFCQEKQNTFLTS
jgi:hypothetical protein